MARRNGVLFALLVSGCFDPWAAYEDPPSSGSIPRYDNPETLAFAVLQAPRLPSYSADGEHFVLGRCKSAADNHHAELSCDIVSVDRRGAVAPLGFRGPLHPDQTRGVRDDFAEQLERLEAHMMEDTGPIVSAVEGGHKVTAVAPYIRLGRVRSYDSPGEVPLAAVSIAGAFELGDVRGSYERRDAVAVEVWFGDGAVAHNAWVLFVRNPDASWRSIVVPPTWSGAPAIVPAAP
jgi:hypothetical protein